MQTWQHISDGSMKTKEYIEENKTVNTQSNIIIMMNLEGGTDLAKCL